MAYTEGSPARQIHLEGYGSAGTLVPDLAAQDLKDNKQVLTAGVPILIVSLSNNTPQSPPKLAAEIEGLRKVGIQVWRGCHGMGKPPKLGHYFLHA